MDGVHHIQEHVVANNQFTLQVRRNGSINVTFMEANLKFFLKKQHYRKKNSLANKTLLTKLNIGIKPQSILVYKSVSEKLDLQTLRWHG